MMIQIIHNSGSRSSSSSDTTSFASDQSLGSDAPSSPNGHSPLGSNSTPHGSDHSSVASGPSSLSRGLSSANHGNFLGTLNDETLHNSKGNKDENHITMDSEQPNVPRKSRRIPKLSKRLDGFVLEGKVKYSLDKVIKYSHLKSEVKCFISSLSKSVEPKTFYEAILDQKWIGAMNLEFEALNLNGTWDCH